MSLSSFESSRFSGEPVNLYLFHYGPLPKNYFAYTDAEQQIEFGVDEDGDPIVYLPVPIERGKITSSGSLDKANLTITTVQNSELANLFLIYPPSYTTSLIMYQGHANDPAKDFRACWSGRVISCARKGSKANFTCEPVSTSMRRNGLRRRYQYGCPHVLYGPGCRADKARATKRVTVASISGSRITLPNGWEGQAGAVKYIQGIAEWTTPDGAREVRTILRVEDGGRTFLLSGAPRGLLARQQVDLVLGCNHQSGTDAQPEGDCGPLHDNILNFGGQERIPLKNPIGFVNQYY